MAGKPKTWKGYRANEKVHQYVTSRYEYFRELVGMRIVEVEIEKIDEYEVPTLILANDKEELIAVSVWADDEMNYPGALIAEPAAFIGKDQHG